MGLSRLSNFLKNVKGNIIYVDPNSLDSTDSTENQGNSLTRPFKTIQRALIEAARFSYQRGKKNDRFLKTTILLYPGEHYIDNRPGWIPSGQDQYTLRNGLSVNALLEWDFQTNFDIFDSSNDLYKLNSVYGGVIVPRGTSIVGMDLRKTKLRPLYVPNPENDEIARTALFRVTGGCYFWQFTVLDGDPNGFIFRDYTGNVTVPNFSHHKLTVFEYADGINPVKIEDDFLTYSTNRTDLEIYYQKIGLVYGQGNGRPISPDYPEQVDIDPVVDEYRVVGTKGLEVGITSIRSGNGIVGTTEVTVFLDSAVDDLSVDTPIQIRGVSEPGYVGQYAVAEVVDGQTFKYIVPVVPDEINPDASGATLNITVDTVSSASPYIFNCSLRSVYGMCGLHADGNNATGFKSMVVAQYTGIGLQKDDKAFVRYDETSGVYIEGDTGDNSHNNSLSRFKPSYENYHIKASNNAFLQLVSVFAIGFANHFLAESGGDHSITNSNSNFGAKSLVSKGFRNESFERDDCGYITHIVTPKTIDSQEETTSFVAIDVDRTVNAVNDPSRLYLYNEKSQSNPPNIVLNGYRIGAAKDSKLYLQIIDPVSGPDVYSADIVMGDTASVGTNALGREIFNISGEKKYRVGRSSSGINTITNNTFFMNEEHSFVKGESVYIIPATNDGLPDGIKSGIKYYVSVENVLNPDLEFQLSSTQQSAESGRDIIPINSKGGILDVVSRSVDKLPGEPGSPIQWDGTQWFISCNPSTNSIYQKLDALYNPGNPVTISNVSSRTFIKRKKDNRDNSDKIYKLRYVLPKENVLTCRPPLDGYIIQDSSSTGLSDSVESSLYFARGTETLTNPTLLRNPKFIAGSSWGSNLATIKTELPHNLKVGSEVSIYNIVSTNNLNGEDNAGYNGTFTVFSIEDSKTFTYNLKEDPGTFGNDINQRSNPDLLPRYVNRRLLTTYQIYKTEEIQPYEKNRKDGIYYLTVINCSNSPSVSPFIEQNFSQPIQYLYPQLSRDNPDSDPPSATSFALPDPIGEVSVNDPRKSITRETLDKSILDLDIGIGITNIMSSSGTAHTIFTEKEHNLNSITNLTPSYAGQFYARGTYYNIPLVAAANSITGSNATAIVEINPSGAVSSVRIMDGGSAYGIGNTLTPVGLTTIPDSAWTPSNTPYFTVTGINSCTGTVLSVSGISTHNDVKFPAIDNYNGKYIITSIPVGQSKSITVQSVKTISNYLPTVGSACENASATVIGTRIPVSGIEYTPSTGIGTVGFTTTHTYKIGSLISLYGATDNFYNNKKFYVTNVNSQLSVRVDMGKSSTTPASSGTIFALPSGLDSNRGDIVPSKESQSSRLIYFYDNFKTNVRVQLNDNSSSNLEVYSVSNSGLKVGDYLLVYGPGDNDYEIMRISRPVTSNQISVVRGLLGTKRKTHIINDVVERIKVKPIEFRRNSIIRASGHTFEYLGFGPGNYSTGLPERQDRILSPQEEILSQSTKIEGGTILYSAMNSDGDFYNNNRKLTSSGKDQVFETPIPTVSGEEPLELITEGGYNLVTSEETIISRSLKVSGGPESNIISEFSGPVVFNEKIKSSSEEGIEVRKLSLKGDLDIPREVAISTSTPSFSGNVGDVIFNASPSLNDNVGWIYTNQDKWEKFGWVNDELYGVKAGVANDLNISQTLKFVGNGITVDNVFDSQSGVTTFTLSSDLEAANQVGLITGTDTTQSPADWLDVSSGTPVIKSTYNVPVVKFVGSDVGFGFKVTSEYGFVQGVGVGTVRFESPLRPLNFGTLADYPGGGLELPTFSTLSAGTRIILENTLTSSSTNYAIGRNGSDIWFSTANYGSAVASGFRFYAGTTQLAYLTSSNVTGGGTTFSVFGDIQAFRRTSPFNAGDIIADGRLVSNTTTDEPVSVASTVICDTLNVQYHGGFAVNRTTNALNTVPVRRFVDTTGLSVDSVSVAQGQTVIAGIVTGLVDRTGVGRDGSFYQNILNITGYTPFKRDGDYSSGISTFTNICEITNALPTSTTPDGSGVLTIDYRNGAVCRYAGVGWSNASTINITNVPGAGGITAASNRSFNFTLIVDPSSVSTLPQLLRIDNTSILNLRWLNGNKPPSSGNSPSSTYVIGFTITITGSTTTALGVYSSYS